MSTMRGTVVEWLVSTMRGTVVEWLECLLREVLWWSG